MKTHNGQGVAKGSPICTNYGLAYDLQAEPMGDQGERTKRFRGALDAVFAETAAQSSEAAVSQVPQQQQMQTPQKPPTAPPLSTPSPVPKPPGPAPQPPNLKPPEPQNKPPEPQQNKTPGPVPPQPSPAPPPQPKPTPAAPPAPAGETQVASGISDNKFQLLLSETDGKFVLLSEHETNKKLAPKTALLLVRDAMLVEQKEGEDPPELPFALKGDKDTGTVMFETNIFLFGNLVVKTILLDLP